MVLVAFPFTDLSQTRRRPAVVLWADPGQADFALAFVTSKDISTPAAGELALLQGKWVLLGTGPDGAEMHSEGRNTETVRRQADGRWLFVIDNPGVAE